MPAAAMHRPCSATSLRAAGALPPEVSDEVAALAERVYHARNKHLGISGHSDARVRRFLAVFGASWGTPRLELRAVGLGPLATELLVDEMLAQPPQRRPRLVQLEQNGLGDQGAAALARLLAQSDSTVWLSAGANSVGPAGALAIFEALAAHNTTLTALDLSSDGATAERNLFARGLRQAELDSLAAAAAEATGAPEMAVPLAAGSDASEDEGGEDEAPPRVLPLLHPRPAIASLCHLLKRSPVLAVLRLGSSALGPEAAAEIGAALPRSAALVELSLPNNGIGSAGTAALVQGAAWCGTLELLDLSSNELGDIGASALGEALAAAAGVPMPFPPDPPSPALSDDEGEETVPDRRRPRPKSSAASGSRPRATCRVPSAPMPLAAPPAPSRLTTLQLGGNRIGLNGARALCAVFGACPCLVALRMPRNEIGDEGAAAIAQAAREAAQALGAPLPLSELILSSNHIGDKGGCELAGALEPRPTATGRGGSASGGVAGGAKAGGATAAGGAAAANGGRSSFAALELVKLDLSSNALRDPCAVHLARILGRGDGTLQAVSLAENKIGDDGGVALGRALGGGGALRRLGLSGNPLGERAGAAIVEGLDGSSVISLGLEVTEVPYACVVAANRLLALNQRRWEEARPRRFEHRRRELQATAEEVDAARVALAERRAEVEAQERRLDRLIMQLAVVTEGAEARKAADRDRLAETERAARASEMASTEEASKLKQDRLIWLETMRTKEASLAAAERVASRAYERFSTVARTSKVGIAALAGEVEPVRQVVKQSAVVLRRAEDEALRAERALLDRRKELLDAGVPLPRDAAKPKLVLPREVAEAEAAAAAAARVGLGPAPSLSGRQSLGASPKKREATGRRTTSLASARGHSAVGKGRAHEPVISSKPKPRPEGEYVSGGAVQPGNSMPHLRS